MYDLVSVFPPKLLLFSSVVHQIGCFAYKNKIMIIFRQLYTDLVFVQSLGVLHSSLLLEVMFYLDIVSNLVYSLIVLQLTVLNFVVQRLFQGFFS